MTPDHWSIIPSDVMTRALRQKPGLFGISYAFERTNYFGDYINHMLLYLNSYEENPVKTDRDYFVRILKNIVFGRVRST